MPHTVHVLADRLKTMPRERRPELDALHVLDESLLQDLMPHGASPDITRRVVARATLAADGGADLITALALETRKRSALAAPLVRRPLTRLAASPLGTLSREGRGLAGAPPSLPSPLAGEGGEAGGRAG